MVDEKMQHKVLARVRKMMNLAQNAGATEGEREKAMASVHKTLAKYNLSLSQVGAAETPEEAREQLGQDFLGKPWAVQIAAAIARLYFCGYFYHNLGGNAGPTQKARHVFVGRHSNVVTAQEMARFVVEETNKAAQRYQRSIGGRYQDYRAFAQAAAQKVSQRCYEIEQHAKTVGLTETQDDQATEDAPLSVQEKAPSTALVLASLYQTEEDANKAFLDNYMKARNVEMRSGRSQTYARGYHARQAGSQFGSQVSLHKQIKETK